MDYPKLFQNAKAPEFTAAIAAILVVLWIFFHRRQRKGASSRLPPGPTPWPIVGNLFQLGRLPPLTLAHFANKYGPIFSLRMGSVTTIVVSSSAMAKVILKTQDSIFANRPKTSVGKYYAYDYKDVAFTPYGASWRQMKKLCMVELFSAKRVECFTPILEEELTYALRFVWKESRCGERAVNLSEIVGGVIEAHVWRIISGMSSDEYRLTESGRQIKELLLGLSHLAGSLNIGEFIPWLDWLDLGGVKRAMRRGQQSFDKVASKILEDHKERRTKSSLMLDKKKKEDVIDALLEMQANDSITMTDEHIKAMVFDFFVGAVDTIATTLGWAMSLIIGNPRVAKKVQEEIEGIVGRERAVKRSDLESMKYLGCVVKETLRLYPASPLLLPHESTQASTIEGYFIPERSRIIINAWALARDPIVWKDPLEFKPERFMSKDVDFLKDKDFFDMVPFGAGRRGCPGVTMAFNTVRLTIAHFMHYFDWHVDGELDMTVEFGIDMPRKHDLLAFPTLRLPTCP